MSKRERYADPGDTLNARDWNTGLRCIEYRCERPAGTAWSPLWCQPCNAARMQRISDQLDSMRLAAAARADAKRLSENAQPPVQPDDPELKLNPTGEPKQ